MALKPEAVQRVLASLKRHADYEFLFGKLQSAEWIQPLLDAGFFKEPPSVEAIGTSIRFPSWPESRFLARVAAQDSGAVLSALTGIPQTDNQLVHQDIADAALSIPAPEAAVLAIREAQWLSTQQSIHFQLPNKYGRLVEHLATGEQFSAATNLAKALLGFRVQERDTSNAFIPPLVVGRISDWDYERLIDGPVMTLIAKDPFQSFVLLSGLLHACLTATQASTDSDESDDSEHANHFVEDYSYIWQEYLDQVANYQRGVRHYLVVATTRAALAAAESRFDVTEVVTALEAIHFAVFHRIALHVLSRASRAPAEMIESRLLDRRLFDNPSVLPNYADLLERRFASISPETQAGLLERIDRGPNRDELAERHARLVGKRPSDADLDRWVAQWKRDRLAPMSKNLPPMLRSKYEALVDILGPPEWDRTSTKTTVGSFGERSPISLEELRSLSLDRLAAYLSEWEPDPENHRPFGPSREGLADTLAELVSEAPSKFANGLQYFRDVPEGYVARILGSLRESVRNGRVTDWGAIVEFGKTRTSVHEARSITNEAGWLRREIASILEDGLSSKTVPIPSSLAESVFVLLSSLLESEPPFDSQTHQDPLSTVLNTTRGRTLFAMLRFGFWIRQAQDAESDIASRLLTAVLDLFDRELGQGVGLPDYAFFGYVFPQLVSLSREWALSNRSRIFSRRPPVSKWAASWSSYISYNRVYLDVVDILESKYRRAIKALPDDKPEQASDEIHLAEHVASMAWSSRLRPSCQRLVRYFFRTASDQERAKAMTSLGRTFRKAKNVSPAHVEFFQNLWRSRTRAASKSRVKDEFSSEMAAFGWWATSDLFPASWRLTNLNFVLDNFGRVEAAFSILEVLPTLAPNHPRETAQAMKSILLMPSDANEFFIGHDSVLETAAVIRQSGDKESLQTLYDLANELGAKGIFEARELIRGVSIDDVPLNTAK